MLMCSRTLRRLRFESRATKIKDVPEKEDVCLFCALNIFAVLLSILSHTTRKGDTVEMKAILCKCNAFTEMNEVAA